MHNITNLCIVVYLLYIMSVSLTSTLAMRVVKIIMAWWSKAYHWSSIVKFALTGRMSATLMKEHPGKLCRNKWTKPYYIFKFPTGIITSACAPLLWHVPLKTREMLKTQQCVSPRTLRWSYLLFAFLPHTVWTWAHFKKKHLKSLSKGKVSFESFITICICWEIHILIGVNVFG